MQVFPNPNDGDFYIRYQLIKNAKVTFSITNMEGQIIEETIIPKANKGENFYQPKLKDSFLSGTFMVTLETDYEKVTQKIVVKR
jgi:hypothetical protein